MKKILYVGLLLSSLVLPKPVLAHAFGQMYTLPIPVWLYLWGGGFAVFVSFLAIGFFVGRGGREFKVSFLDISNFLLVKTLDNDTFKFVAKFLSVLFLFFLLASGYLGSVNPTENFAPLFVWIVFWLGFTYTVGIFGDIWSVICPWNVIVEFLEKAFNFRFDGVFKAKNRNYLGAFLIYFVFIWLELLSNGWGVRPRYFANILVIYTVMNFLGVFLVGRKAWFSHFEFFSVFFSLISKISPLEKRGGALVIRLPFVGLLEGEADDFSLVLFILFMLSSTAFDGFRSTIAWRRIDVVILSISNNSAFYEISQVLVLFLSPLFFLGLYLYALVFLKMFVKTTLSIFELSRKFAFSLIPIALAYNVAHYWTLLLIQGQSIIPQISDPFGKGWNLFGTASFTPNPAIVSASFVWHSEVVAIIVGHIAGVFVAHLISLRMFRTHKEAVLGQVPILVLMVIYTTVGLWILSQPLTLKG